MCLFGKSLDDLEDESSSTNHSVWTSRNSLQDPRFIVIGAGAAGLACATKLLETFSNVLILEAQERIGGRIYTIPFADNCIDLGAQWCHGEEENIVYQMVKDKNVLDTSGDVYVTFDCIRSNGEIVDEAITSRLKEIIRKIFINRHDHMQNFKGSLGEFLTSRYYEVLKQSEFHDIDPHIAKEFFENFKRLESSESAAGIDEVSAIGFSEYWECEGDYMLNWKTVGYQYFLRILTGADIMMNDFGKLEGKIIFNSRVDSIHYDRDDARVEVKCSNNIFVADHVILTMSLGVLKENYLSMFKPPLPPWKVNAIQNIGYGTVCKIFLEFEAPFWAKNWTGFNTLWIDRDREKLMNSPNDWLEDIYGIYCVNYQPRVLVAWCVGENATRIETIPTKELTEQLMFLIRKFLRHLVIPDPLQIYVTDWKSNPNFCGTYSFRSMLTENNRTGAVTLSQPITVLTHILNDEHDMSSDPIVGLTVKPIILFAGEATSQHYYSTVHGAVDTGYREATRLEGYYSTEF